MTDDEDPFEALEGEAAEDPPAIEELFAESTVDDIDADAVWEELEAERTPGDDGEAIAADIHVVPKRAFCQECPHLAEPPVVSCTHEGTEILDFPDRDHVRVRNCPVVEDRGGVMTAEESDQLP